MSTRQTLYPDVLVNSPQIYIHTSSNSFIMFIYPYVYPDMFPRWLPWYPAFWSTHLNTLIYIYTSSHSFIYPYVYPDMSSRLPCYPAFWSTHLNTLIYIHTPSHSFIYPCVDPDMSPRLLWYPAFWSTHLNTLIYIHTSSHSFSYLLVASKMSLRLLQRPPTEHQCELIYRCCVFTHVLCWLFSVRNKVTTTYASNQTCLPGYHNTRILVNWPQHTDLHSYIESSIRLPIRLTRHVSQATMITGILVNSPQHTNLYSYTQSFIHLPMRRSRHVSPATMIPGILVNSPQHTDLHSYIQSFIQLPFGCQQDEPSASPATTNRTSVWIDLQILCLYSCIVLIVFC